MRVEDRAVREITRRERHALFVETCDIIEHEYASNLTVDSVAREIGTSRRALQRALAPYGGFRTLLCRRRMDIARGLLVNTDLPIREVCGMVGWRQAAQFAKTFRVMHGMSPREYRRRARDPQYVTLAA